MKNEIILYQADEVAEHLEVRIQDETVWLNRNQIATLFGRDVKTIGKRINNVFSEGELDKNMVVAKFATTTKQIKKAKKEIIVIDNFIDDSVLTLLSKRTKNVDATIYTKTISKALKLDLKKHNAQYPSIDVKVFDQRHDRFLIIDRNDLYHIGASLKDLGKKHVVSEVEPWFAFSKMDSMVNEVLNKMNQKP